MTDIAIQRYCDTTVNMQFLRLTFYFSEMTDTAIRRYRLYPVVL